MLRVQISFPSKSKRTACRCRSCAQTFFPSVTGDGDDIFCFICLWSPSLRNFFHSILGPRRSTLHRYRLRAFRDVEKNMITPHDGRRAAPSRQREFPGDIFLGRPFHRQIGFAAGRIEIRPAPLRPIFRRRAHAEQTARATAVLIPSSIQSVLFGAQEFRAAARLATARTPRATRASRRAGRPDSNNASDGSGKCAATLEKRRRDRDQRAHRADRPCRRSAERHSPRSPCAQMLRPVADRAQQRQLFAPLHHVAQQHRAQPERSQQQSQSAQRLKRRQIGILDAMKRGQARGVDITSNP